MSPQPVLGMFLSAAFRYILSLFTLCLSQKRPASPSPRASGPMGETPPRTDPPKSALQVARPRALSPGLSALPAVHPLPAVQRPGHGPARQPSPIPSLAAPPRGFVPPKHPAAAQEFFRKNSYARKPAPFHPPIHPSRNPCSPQPHPWQTGVSRNFWHPCCSPPSSLPVKPPPPRNFTSSPPPPSARPSPKPPTQFRTDSNPSVRVVSNFAGSQVLRLQIESGARADLFVSANPDHLDSLQRDALLLAPPTVVATNELVLAVPSGNSARISGIQDLTQPGRRVVMAAESVPAGAYARQMLALQAAATGRPELADAVLQRVISFETNVRQVAAKLELGEADAGFVYRTDVLASDGRLQVIETPSQVRVTANYPAAVLRDAPNPQLAERFLTFLRSPEAQAILTRHGFRPRRMTRRCDDSPRRPLNRRACSSTPPPARTLT